MPKLARKQRAQIVREKLLPIIEKHGDRGVFPGYALIHDPMHGFAGSFRASTQQLEVNFENAKVMNVTWERDGRLRLSRFSPGNWDERLCSIIDAGQIDPARSPHLNLPK